MGLFDLFKKKESSKRQNLPNGESITMLSMALFDNGETFDAQRMVQHLTEYWKCEVELKDSQEGTTSFDIDGEMVLLSTISAQVPYNDISQVASYAYNWKNASEDLKNHNAHALIVVISTSASGYVRHSVQTKVTASLIATSSCIGIYDGSKSLLIPRDQYLDSARALFTQQVPVDLWIYIGKHSSDKGNSVYSYGLSSFGKMEVEVIDSQKSLEELFYYLTNICSYVIKNDVIFNSGETLGYSQNEKINIFQSEGVFLQGETLKFEM